MANETFLSYARKDKEIVRQLFDELLNRNIDLWLDLEDIRGGTVWMDALLTAIQNCHNFLYCISENSIESPYCAAELAHALRLNKRIIPVVVRDIQPDRCPQPIRELQWVLIHRDFKFGIDELTSILESPEGISWGDRLDSKLEIISKGRPTRILGLYRKCYLIGRNPETDIQQNGIIIVEERGVKKPQISRSHLQLALKVGRWHAIDVSRNGTQINGRELQRGENRALKHNDVLKLSTHIRLIYQEIHTQELQAKVDSRETGV
jgi:hypothetical protein